MAKTMVKTIKIDCTKEQIKRYGVKSVIWRRRRHRLVKIFTDKFRKTTWRAMPRFIRRRLGWWWSPPTTAYIYAPHIPLLVTDRVLSPDDFQPRTALMSRYAMPSALPVM